MTLSRGDRVIFSSRPIPGNEKAIGRVINGLIDQGVEVITDRTHLVHVSGHPRRAELEDMIGWVKPATVIPVHGEALHLAEHATLARKLGVNTLISAATATWCGSRPARPTSSTRCRPAGSTRTARCWSRRRPHRRRPQAAELCRHRLVSLAINDKGAARSPIRRSNCSAFPELTADGKPMIEIAYDAVLETFETLPQPRRRDPDAVAEAVRRGVRAAVGAHWGKKPNVTCTCW